MTSRQRLRILPFVLVTMAVAACGSATAPSAAAPSPTPPAANTPPDSGTAPGDAGGSGSSGSAGDPNAPVGTDVPPGGGEPPGFDPNSGRIVVPRPGQLDVRPIGAQTLTAAVDGRHVVISVAYASGVEPCSVLDSIVVRTGPGTFEITLREGRGPGDNVCIDIAEFKRAIVDLGELAPGTYTISDSTGTAAPISVVVS
jgi:hypothetical protein